MKFDKAYYTTRNYTNYLDRQARYIHTAREITTLLASIKLINKNSKILDYGCATGFLMKGLIEAGYKNVVGYDISEWAVDQARDKMLHITEYKPQDFDFVFSLDVFEHMTDAEIQDAVRTFDTNYILMRIPVAQKHGHGFHLEVSNNDPTHINCKTKSQWKMFFSQLGYSLFLELDLYTIYDSDGVWCAIAMAT